MKKIFNYCITLYIFIGRSFDLFGNTCTTTISTEHILKKPEVIYTSNNLTRKSNSIFFSKGKSMILEGYILDQDCVPVSNATVELWQENYEGLNQSSIPDIKIIDDEKTIKKYDQSFAGSGSTRTNNLGFYRFIISRSCNNCLQGVDITVKSDSKELKNFDSFISFENNIESTKNEDDHKKSAQPNSTKKGNRKPIKSKNRNEELKEEIKILCEEQNAEKCTQKDNIQKDGKNYPKASLSVIEGNDPIYKFNVVLQGQSKYRKY